MDYSSITIMGRVQPRDAEKRFTAGGSEQLTWRMVVNRKHKGASGEYEDAADWYQVSCFGKLAEMMADKAVKGERLLVSGRFSTRDWTDNEGRTHKNLEIVASDVLVANERPKLEPQQQPEREETNDLDQLPF